MEIFPKALKQKRPQLTKEVFGYIEDCVHRVRLSICAAAAATVSVRGQGELILEGSDVKRVFHDKLLPREVPATVSSVSCKIRQYALHSLDTRLVNFQLDVIRRASNAAEEYVGVGETVITSSDVDAVFDEAYEEWLGRQEAA